MAAACVGSLKSMILLLKYGATIDRLSSFGSSALTIACCLGRLQIVKLLCELGAMMDIPTADGETLQNLAAQHMQHEIVMFLLEVFSCVYSKSHYSSRKKKGEK